MSQGAAFLVIGRNQDGSAFLATRRTFPTCEAAEQYRDGIASCYEPEIVESLPVIVRRPADDPVPALIAALREVKTLVIGKYMRDVVNAAIAQAEKAVTP
jgi:hypothetical protein